MYTESTRVLSIGSLICINLHSFFKLVFFFLYLKI